MGYWNRIPLSVRSHSSEITRLIFLFLGMITDSYLGMMPVIFVFLRKLKMADLFPFLCRYTCAYKCVLTIDPYLGMMPVIFVFKNNSKWLTYGRFSWKLTPWWLSHDVSELKNVFFCIGLHREHSEHYGEAKPFLFLLVKDSQVDWSFLRTIPHKINRQVYFYLKLLF